MIAILLPAVLFFLGPLAGTHQGPPDKSSSRVVIDAVAVDKNGMPVVDLRPEEVEVWIGHFRVPIESFTAVTPATSRGGRLTILVLDDMTMPPALIGRARDAAKRFVSRMGPDDQMAIVSLDGSSMETTNDSAKLLRTIDRYTGQNAGMIPLDRLGEHVLKTLGALSRALVEAGDQRKTIVAIGSGWLFDRPIPPVGAGMDPRKEWVAAMQAMALAHVNLYVIDPGGVSMARADNGSTGFARETGGLAYLATNDLNAAADKIMREAANYYLIGVADPPVGRGAELREVEVKVLRRGVTIRARRTITGGT
jgi:VWFA-related protein